LDYTDNYLVYDRSDTDERVKPLDQAKVKRVPNIGWDIYDKLTYIIENYDNLPDVVILSKGNVFNHITKEEFDGVCNNKQFTPLLTKQHKTSMPVSFYSEDGMFNEINNSWYLKHLPAKYFNSYNEFISRLGIDIPKYIKFAPGSNYIVTKEDIYKHPKTFYEKLRNMIDYTALPGEGYIIERFMYTLWTTNKKFKPEMITLVPKNIFILFFKKIRGFFLRNILNK